MLYRRAYNVPLLRCISHEQAQHILAEIHEGICRDHAGERVLAGKAMRASYYRLHALKDAEEYVWKSKKCQEYARILHHPPVELVPIVTP